MLYMCEFAKVKDSPCHLLAAAAVAAVFCTNIAGRFLFFSLYICIVLLWFLRVCCRVHFSPSFLCLLEPFRTFIYVVLACHRYTFRFLTSLMS